MWAAGVVAYMLVSGGVSPFYSGRSFVDLFIFAWRQDPLTDLNFRNDFKRFNVKQKGLIKGEGI